MTHQREGQGLVEFALILPAFLLLIMGIVEFGRLMFYFTSVSTASREAARYGASVGVGPSGFEHYRDCDAIRETARRLVGFVPLEDSNIAIEYDNPTTGFHETSCPPSQFQLGDRIIVRVSLTFEPIVPLVNVPPIPVVSETRRTVLRDVYIR